MSKHTIELNDSFVETEAGNILIVNEEGGWFNSWIKLGIDIWFEIIWRPNDYPSLTVSIIHSTSEKLAAHIMDRFAETGGWKALKLNHVEGITLDSQGFIVTPEEKKVLDQIEAGN